MTILAIEFSSPERSVAVVQTGHGEKAADGAPHPRSAFSEIVERGGRSANLLGMIEEALRQAQIERERIGLLAIGLGPGSYTGIRAAIAMAQGWQLARGTKLAGISSVECLAAQAQAEKIFGRVDIVIDAQREEFYVAGYELTPDGRRELEPLRIVGRSEVETRAKEGAVMVGPEVTKWFPEGRLLFPGAAILGEVAAGRTDFIPGEKLEPIYLRETKFVKAPPPRIIPE